jgi:hypothetical protein
MPAKLLELDKIIEVCNSKENQSPWRLYLSAYPHTGEQTF